MASCTTSYPDSRLWWYPGTRALQIYLRACEPTCLHACIPTYIQRLWMSPLSFSLSLPLPLSLAETKAVGHMSKIQLWLHLQPTGWDHSSWRLPTAESRRRDCSLERVAPATAPPLSPPLPLSLSLSSSCLAGRPTADRPVSGWGALRRKMGRKDARERGKPTSPRTHRCRRRLASGTACCRWNAIASSSVPWASP